MRGVAAVAIGGAMATFVALTYMRLGEPEASPQHSPSAAVFWLMVMFGLGGMDPATRHDVLLQQTTH